MLHGFMDARTYWPLVVAQHRHPRSRQGFVRVTANGLPCVHTA